MTRKMTGTIGTWLAAVVCITLFTGCRGGDGNALIKQTGTTALVLAAAGFDGSFEAHVEPSSRFYLMEGVGADFPGTRLSASGKMNPGAVSVEKLEQIVTLLERLSAIEELKEEQE